MVKNCGDTAVEVACGVTLQWEGMSSAEGPKNYSVACGGPGSRFPKSADTQNPPDTVLRMGTFGVPFIAARIWWNKELFLSEKQ